MKINKKAFSLIELSIVILVVGLLIAGVVTGSRVIGDSRLKTARTLTQSSSISSLSGLVMWFDATNLDNISSGTLSSNRFGIAEDGDAIVTWRDQNPQSQYKTDITIPGDNRAPTYVDDAINNLPSIKFNSSGVGDYFINDNIKFANNDYSIFFVFEPFTSGLYDILSIGSDSKPGLMIELQSDGEVRHLHRYPYSLDSTGDSFITDASNYQADKPQIYSFVREGSDTTSRIWIDNNLKETNTTTTQGFDQSILQVTIGALYFNGSYERFINGYLSEIVIFDRALRDKDRKSVQDYLAQKYQISIAN